VARPPRWHHTLGPEARWVLAHGCTTELVAPAQALPPDRWAHLLVDAGAHRLEGLLVHAVATGALPVTAAQAEDVAHIEIDLTHARLWQEQRLVDVVGRVGAAGVDVRVLKGLALAVLDYPDPQMRPTGDVDLLVRGADLDRVGVVLAAGGATRTDPDPRPGYATVVGKGATWADDRGEVDLHRLLVWGPLGVRLDPDLLWSEARTFTVADRSLTTLGLDDTVLHACAHLLVLGTRRALQLRDVAELVASPDLDTGRLLGRARAWGAEALLATAVLLAARELDLRLETELGRWAVGCPPTWRDRLWLRVERPAQPLWGLEAAATFAELPTRHARAELVRATLRPDPGTWPTPSARARSLGRHLLAGR
jgi:hypothetical protein